MTILNKTSFLFVKNLFLEWLMTYFLVISRKVLWQYMTILLHHLLKKIALKNKKLVQNNMSGCCYNKKYPYLSSFTGSNILPHTSCGILKYGFIFSCRKKKFNSVFRKTITVAHICVLLMCAQTNQYYDQSFNKAILYTTRSFNFPLQCDIWILNHLV